MNCDACILFRGDVRYDSRLSNVLQTLHRAGQSCRVIQGAHSEEAFEYHGAWVESFECGRSGPSGFAKYWRTASRLANDLHARFFWAAELYSLPVAAKQARSRDAKLVYDSREIFAHLGALQKRPLTQKFWRFIERRYIRRAHSVITTGVMDADFLTDRYGIECPVVILNVPQYREVERFHLIHDSLGIGREIPICLYTGGLQSGRGVELMLELARAIPEAAFVFVGSGPLSARVTKAQTANVYHIPAVPNDQLIDLAASATIGLALIEPISFSYQLALPNKLFEYIMAGTPVITTNLPQMKRIVDNYRVGMTVPPGDIDAASDALRRMFSDSAFYSECAANCRTAARTLSWDTEQTKLLNHLRAKQII